MPAAVETAVFSALPAWHGLGTVIDPDGNKGITVEVALRESEIDWMVAKTPVVGFNLDLGIKSKKDLEQKIKNGDTLSYSDLKFIDDRYGVQRQTDGSILGVVGSTWQPVQNHEGFQIINDVIEQAGGSVWIEAAGSLECGQRVWILAHVDQQMQIAGEKYASYLLFTNGHNGRASVTAACIDMRVVCANTLDWGLQEANQSGRIVRVRHTTKAADRIKEAHQILGMRNTRAEELAKQGEWLVEQTMNDGDFNNFLETLMPIPEDAEDKPAGTMINNRRDQIRSIYFDAENLNPIRGTWWSGHQAVLEYSDHARDFKTAESKVKAQWGITAQPLKQQSYNLVTAFAAAV